MAMPACLSPTASREGSCSSRKSRWWAGARLCAAAFAHRGEVSAKLSVDGRLSWLLSCAAVCSECSWFPLLLAFVVDQLLSVANLKDESRVPSKEEMKYCSFKVLRFLVTCCFFISLSEA